MTSQACPKCGQVHDPEKCTGHNARGLPCGKTPIKGATVCRTHGGSAPQVRDAAEQRLLLRRALLEAETLGLPREIDPHSALLEELHRTAGAVQWLGAVVADLEQERLVAGGSATAYVKLWQEERDKLVRVAQACINAGIEERRVRLAEQAGAQVASVIRSVLDALLVVLLRVLGDLLTGHPEIAHELFVRAFEAAWSTAVLEIVPRELRRLSGPEEEQE